jgi:imidazolonepropionase-like amidohydrolase
MARASRSAAMVALLAALVAPAGAQDNPVREKIAVKAGKIITVSGRDIEGGVILIEDGRIKAVGKDIEVPWDANVIEATDKVVMPGFVEAQTSSGMGTPNERVLEVPFVSAKDGVDPKSVFMEDSLRDGVTTMLMIPGNDTLLGGTGLVIKPFGLTVEELLVRDYTGLKISLQPRGDSSRMAHIARFRKYMADLDRYLEDYDNRKADAEAAKKPFDEELDPQKKPMIDLKKGLITAFVYCPMPSDVAKAFELADEYKLKIVPVLGAQCYKAADLLAKRGLPVILDSALVVWETNEDTETEEMKVVPKIMADAGVKFALQRDSYSYETRYLWMAAARCVAYGISREEALKSVTLNPAEIIGVGDRVGSIEVGKDANLLILTGDPLDAQTWVDQVLIEGKVRYRRADDERLKKLLEERKPPAEDKKPDEGKKPEEKPAPPPAPGEGAPADKDKEKPKTGQSLQ